MLTRVSAGSTLSATGSEGAVLGAVVTGVIAGAVGEAAGASRTGLSGRGTRASGSGAVRWVSAGTIFCATGREEERRFGTTGASRRIGSGEETGAYAEGGAGGRELCMTGVAVGGGRRVGTTGEVGATATLVGIGRGIPALGGAGDWAVPATEGMGLPAGGLPQ